jgi:hypothetical protein
MQLIRRCIPVSSAILDSPATLQRVEGYRAPTTNRQLSCHSISLGLLHHNVQSAGRLDARHSEDAVCQSRYGSKYSFSKISHTLLSQSTSVLYYAPYVTPLTFQMCDRQCGWTELGTLTSMDLIC